MPSNLAQLLATIPADRPVLIAGPTASGKSALALAIAEAQGGVIVNADALQVFARWHVLTARPSSEEQSRAHHVLYGHVGDRQTYSAGHWLRELAPLLHGSERSVIVGGTGLYFTALTQGLAEIPNTPDGLRAKAMTLDPDQLRAALDPETLSRIDTQNPARLRRAWEVLQNTGRGLADWQDRTPPPLLPVSQAVALLVDAPKDWLTPRIERRFDLMLAQGALDEARAALDTWDPSLPSAKAIGAPELIDHLNGRRTLDEARAAAVIATRQYAKRQRTWFRARMSDWQTVSGAEIAGEA